MFNQPLTWRALRRMFLGLGAAALAGGTVIGGLASTAGAAPVHPDVLAASPLSAPVKPHIGPLVNTRTSVIPKTIRPLPCPPLCLLPWSVSISANPHLLWGTQSSTITATANRDVGPTPDYLSIYNVNTGTFVKECGTGTVCTATVSEPVPSYQSYQAVVGPLGTRPFTSGALASAGGASGGVEWQDVGPVSVTSSAGTTLGLGGTTVLTASTLLNVGPTPFYIQIFDATTGTRLAACGVGTSCSAVVSQSAATTHRYLAYVSAYNGAFPPPSVQDTSSSIFVTWSPSGWRISLSAVTTGGNIIAIANTNMDVGPTPYYIEILNQNGTRLAECPSGTSCTASFFLSSGGEDLVAFVSALSTSLPPVNTQASSSVVHV